MNLRRPPLERQPTNHPIDAAVVSHVGGRKDNQDRGHVSERVGAVSDGMGGYTGGARAAELTIAALERAIDHLGLGLWTDDAVTAVFTRANDQVRRERSIDRNVAQMGATLTMAAQVSLSDGASEWIVAHAGDSPAYLVTHDEAVAVTLDHTIPAQLLSDGSISESEARAHPYRSMLLRAIGTERSIQPDLTRVRLTVGQTLVLVSDGVSGVIDPHDLWTMTQPGQDAAVLAESLAAEAIERGTTDNVTAVVLRHVGPLVAPG